MSWMIIKIWNSNPNSWTFSIIPLIILHLYLDLILLYICILSPSNFSLITLHPAMPPPHPPKHHVSPWPWAPLGFSKRGVCVEQLSCQSWQHSEFCSVDPLPTSHPPPPSPSEPLSLRNSGQRGDWWRRSLTGKYSIEGVCRVGGHNERIEPATQYSVWTLRWLRERIAQNQSELQPQHNTAGRPSMRPVGNIYTDQAAKLKFSLCLYGEAC